MVVILYQSGCRQIARNIASDLATAFADHVLVKTISASAISGTDWPEEPSWDDLLIVVYNGNAIPPNGNAFIQEYLRQRPDGAMLLPVALDSTSPKPPDGAAAIKALPYDASAQGPSGRLVNRVGGMLGLRVQGRDSTIFISYRASDGKKMAAQLHDHLRAVGHRPWLDEAKELDGDTKILPGSPVQQEIDNALGNANLVLLLDTPDAPASIWIKHEVDTADGLLLPVLPICFRDVSDPKKGPRFPSLLALQRWLPLPIPSKRRKLPLSADQIDEIVYEAEQYLCEIFRRKCRVPFVVKKEFVSRGFAWKVLDQRLLMFESSKKQSPRLSTKILSHCSIFDPGYTPAMTRFGTFLKSTARANHSLFIYDGELLPDWQLQELAEAHDDPVIILHHQELAALVDSNFSVLGRA